MAIEDTKLKAIETICYSFEDYKSRVADIVEGN